jgi:phage pi2 protein 07
MERPMADHTNTVDKLTSVFVKIRDKRAELAAEFKAKDDELKEKQEVIKGHLLQHCKDHNVDSVRTAGGMFYRTVKTRYWTSDWEAMHQFVLKHELPEFFEKRLNQGAVKEFLEENPETVPPGLNVDSKYEITVRKK